MSLQSLYRRYRPQKFGDIVGQAHIVGALKNAVASERVGHAYLFSGPRGTGKTSMARILAKALNCEKPVDGEPCDKCDPCSDIRTGRSFDLMELDAASNNGVDAIRDLISMVATAPIGNYKVYVIDEVHMLSSGAENALLKTLEEPPDHVVFVMATTEPHKVVDTVRSRAQHFEFGLLGQAELEKHLKWVGKDAGLKVSDSDMEYILKAGAGSARDSLSAMDQVAAAGTAPEKNDVAIQLVDGISSRDTTACIKAVSDCVSGGGDLRVFISQAVDILRNAFLMASNVLPEGLTAEDEKLAKGVVEKLKLPMIVKSIEDLGECMAKMRSSPDPRVDLEVTLFRLARVSQAQLASDISDVIQIFEKLRADAKALAENGANRGERLERSPSSSPSKEEGLAADKAKESEADVENEAAVESGAEKDISKVDKTTKDKTKKDSAKTDDVKKDDVKTKKSSSAKTASQPKTTSQSKTSGQSKADSKTKEANKTKTESKTKTQSKAKTEKDSKEDIDDMGSKPTLGRVQKKRA